MSFDPAIELRSSYANALGELGLRLLMFDQIVSKVHILITTLVMIRTLPHFLTTVSTHRNFHYHSGNPYWRPQ